MRKECAAARSLLLACRRRRLTLSQEGTLPAGAPSGLSRYVREHAAEILPLLARPDDMAVRRFLRSAGDVFVGLAIRDATNPARVLVAVEPTRAGWERFAATCQRWELDLLLATVCRDNERPKTPTRPAPVVTACLKAVSGVRSLAEASGWPRLPLRLGVYVAAGPDGWRAFLETCDAELLCQAADALGSSDSQTRAQEVAA